MKILKFSTGLFTGLICGAVLAIAFICTNGIPVPKTFTIEKSSDSEWERSKTNFSDTTTIDTLYFNKKADTVYRTIQYIRITL